MIRYLSTSMPLIEELSADGERINVEEEEDAPPVEIPAIDTKQCCERTFITFSNDAVMESNFNRSKPISPKPNICPITRFAALFLFI